MNHRLEKAIYLLENEKKSCVIFSKENEYRTSNEIGIKPLMIELRKNQAAFAGCVIADKVIGKAAALMMALGKAEAVYGAVMSENAKAYFDAVGMEYSFGKLVPYIENRTKNGRCPMEETVLAINSPEEAFEALEETIAKLMKQKQLSNGV